MHCEINYPRKGAPAAAARSRSMAEGPRPKAEAPALPDTQLLPLLPRIFTRPQILEGARSVRLALKGVQIPRVSRLWKSRVGPGNPASHKPSFSSPSYSPGSGEGDQAEQGLQQRSAMVGAVVPRLLRGPLVALRTPVHPCGSVRLCPCASTHVETCTHGCVHVLAGAPLCRCKSLLSAWRRGPRRRLVSPTPHQVVQSREPGGTGEEQAGLLPSPSSPPHTAAEAPAGHGLDLALWTSLTLASDLNIWQQADKGCSGNSVCGCQEPRPPPLPFEGSPRPHPLCLQLRTLPLSLFSFSASVSLSPISTFPLSLFLNCSRSFRLSLPLLPLSCSLSFSPSPSPLSLPPSFPFSFSDHFWVCNAGSGSLFSHFLPHFSVGSFFFCLSPRCSNPSLILFLHSISVPRSLVCLFLVPPPGNRPGTLGKSPLRRETLCFVYLGRVGGGSLGHPLLLPLWVGLMAWDHLGWSLKEKTNGPPRGFGRGGRTRTLQAHCLDSNPSSITPLLCDFGKTWVLPDPEFFHLSNAAHGR